MAKKIRHLLNRRSILSTPKSIRVGRKTIDINNPKAPYASNIEYGELAINYGNGHEALFIRNSEDKVIQFNTLRHIRYDGSVDRSVKTYLDEHYLNTDGGVVYGNLKLDGGVLEGKLKNSINLNVDGTEFSFNNENGVNVEKTIASKEYVDAINETINENINVINGNIGTINENIDNIENDVQTINESITSINENIDTVKSDITAINGNIATIEGEITTQANEINTINEKVTEFDDKIVTVEGKIPTDYISNTGGTINGDLIVIGTVTANDIINASDKALKNNVSPISDEDINNVANVELKSYKLNSDSSNRLRYGVIAQELEENNLSNLVIENGDGIKGVNYVSFLILKIKQLEREIEKLKA